MKKIITMAVISILTFEGCKKAPTFKGGTDKGTPFAGQCEDDDSCPMGEGDEIANPIKGTKVAITSEYTGLQCTASDTPTGFRAWRRLSNVEYKNTVASVFGVSDVDFSGLPDDITHADIYDTMMIPSNFMNSLRFNAYKTLSKSIAAKVDINKTFSCLKDGASCMTKTLPTLGLLAWRRPLTSDEVSKLTAIYSDSLTDLGSEPAARLIVQALLLAESFVYRSELGTKGSDGTYTLTDWEMASALSYTIQRMPPDATLRALAASKGLSSTDAIKKQIARLFADAQSKNAGKDFARMWLDSKAILTTDRPAVKEFNADVKASANAEAGDLYAELMTKTSGGTFAALLTANSIPTSGKTSVIYDTAANSGRITFKESERRGILGLGSFLASTAADDHTSPVKRGAFIVERIMCVGFGPVPAVGLPARKEGESNRDRYLGLEKLNGCNKCHTTMNQFGFAFENFDMQGKFRKEDDSGAITVNSKISLDGKDITVHSAAEFGEAVSKSEQGRECFARHVFRYGMGRHELSPIPVIGADPSKMNMITSQTMADNCQIKAISDALGENGDLKVPLMELLSNPAFRQRTDRRPQ